MLDLKIVICPGHFENHDIFKVLSQLSGYTESWEFVGKQYHSTVALMSQVALPQVNYHIQQQGRSV